MQLLHRVGRNRFSQPSAIVEQRCAGPHSVGQVLRPGLTVKHTRVSAEEYDERCSEDRIRNPRFTAEEHKLGNDGRSLVPDRRQEVLTGKANFAAWLRAVDNWCSGL